MYALAANYLFFMQLIVIWLNFLHEFWSFGLLTSGRGVVWVSSFLNRADETRGIRLESAAWVFHMICVT